MTKANEKQKRVIDDLEIAELEHIALCMYLFLRGLTGSDGVVYCPSETQNTGETE